MTKTPKILLTAVLVISIAYATSFCDEKDSKWEYGVKLLPLSANYNEVPIDTSVKVLIPTYLPPPNDQEWSGTAENNKYQMGISGTWRWGGPYIKRRLEYKKYLNFAVECAIEHYAHDDIVTHWGNPFARYKAHKTASFTVPKVMFYWEPVKYFSLGLGYGAVFWQYKHRFYDFEFVPYKYTGDVNISGYKGFVLYGVAFNLPVKNFLFMRDFVVGLESYWSISEPWPEKWPKPIVMNGQLIYPDYDARPGARLVVTVLKVGFN